MKPKFCPNCGKKMNDIVECYSGYPENYWIDSHGVQRSNLIYDCYCDECEWSGDISPDDDLDSVVDEEIDAETLRKMEELNEKFFGKPEERWWIYEMEEE